MAPQATTDQRITSAEGRPEADRPDVLSGPLHAAHGEHDARRAAVDLLDAHREPDLRYVEQTARDIARVLRPGQMVILESTTWPGTTDSVVRPILETRVTYNATEDLHQVHLEPAPLTDEEQVEADKLLETISALEAESETLDEDDEAAAAEFQTRWDAASSAYDALHDKPPVIPEEMKANVPVVAGFECSLGCVVNLLEVVHYRFPRRLPCRFTALPSNTTPSSTRTRNFDSIR